MTIYDTKISDFQEAAITGTTEKISLKDYQELSKTIVDVFGLDELSQLIFFKTKTVVKLKSKKLATGDESLGVHIEIAEKELSNLTDKVKVGNVRQVFSQNHRILSKWCLSNTRDLMIFDYYTYLKDYQKEMKDARSDKQRLNTKTGYSR